MVRHRAYDVAELGLTFYLRFPSRRELAPAVRVFVDFMKEVTARGALWQKDPSGEGQPGREGAAEAARRTPPPT